MNSPTHEAADPCHREARRFLQAVRHWMRMHGHHDRLPKLMELLDGPTPAHWHAAAAHCVEIAQFMDAPDAKGRDTARQLRAHDTTECLRNASEAIARALQVMNS